MRENVRKELFWKVAILVFICNIYYILPIENIGNKYTICLYKNITHHDCPTCGITRGFWLILHGEIVKAEKYNKYSMLLFPCISIGLVSWVFQINMLRSIKKIFQK